MKEMINNLGEMLVHQMRLVNQVRASGEYTDNLRKCPFYSEFYGVIMALRCMNIDFEIDWCPDDVYTMSAITIMGIRFDL